MKGSGAPVLGLLHALLEPFVLKAVPRDPNSQTRILQKALWWPPVVWRLKGQAAGPETS